MSGQAIRTMRFRRDAIYHLLVQDEAGGLLPCKFFHGGYLEGRLKPGQLLILHGKVEIDRLRPARLEMINPQIELLNSDEIDSTEVGRIVPIYEAIGTFSSKQIRRAMYAAVQLIDPRMPDVLPESLRRRLGYPSRGEALIHTHFPEPTESLDDCGGLSGSWTSHETNRWPLVMSGPALPVRTNGLYVALVCSCNLADAASSAAGPARGDVA